ncbi:NUDIX hydrolase [Sphaerimonospora cavernae]|uniref:NUDIX hydrolase n=1 Tax=Sphaerimonospora cavernae TaxID=1740611 RepID=A0ABV6UC52_9ACTN
MQSIRCVGAIVVDESGRLLLIRRGRPPAEGRWSLPGGRVEPGETDAEAVRRELREETGLDVTVDRWAGAVERPGPGGVTYEIHDYVATADPPAPLSPGDDAADARWCRPTDLVRLPLTHGLLEALHEWGILSQDAPNYDIRDHGSREQGVTDLPS